MTLGLLILRLVVGGLFIGHGAQKLFGSFGGHGLDGTAQFMESLDMKPGRRHATAAGVAEFGGGILLVFGLFTPIAAAAITAVMVVAILTVHYKNGPWVTEQGYEYNLVLIATALCLAGVGAGNASLDHAFGLGLAGTGWLLAALALGILGAIGAVLSGRRTTATPAPTRTRVTPTDRFARTDDVAERPRARATTPPLDAEQLDELDRIPPR
jgi:putative oxidoreductase